MVELLQSMPWYVFAVRALMKLTVTQVTALAHRRLRRRGCLANFRQSWAEESV
jgi:hypothetical protein